MKILKLDKIYEKKFNKEEINNCVMKDKMKIKKRTKIVIFLTLLFIAGNILAEDSLEVIMTFEMPKAVTFRPHYGGNFNNDNYDDLLYTYYNSSTHETKLQFYFGNPNPEPIPDLEYEIVSYIAGQPSWSGDLNNDCYKDIVLSITYDVLYPGDIYVFLGTDIININPDEPDIIFYGWHYAPDPIGLFFCGSNNDVDFNGDGYADILAGGIGPDWFFNGQVDLFFGGEEIDTIPEFHIQGAILDQFGLFKTVGDINGDGYCDLIASRSIEFDGPLKYEIYLG